MIAIDLPKLEPLDPDSKATKQKLILLEIYNDKQQYFSLLTKQKKLFFSQGTVKVL